MPGHKQYQNQTNIFLTSPFIVSNRLLQPRFLKAFIIYFLWVRRIGARQRIHFEWWLTITQNVLIVMMINCLSCKSTMCKGFPPGELKVLINQPNLVDCNLRFLDFLHTNSCFVRNGCNQRLAYTYKLGSQRSSS